MRRTDPGTLWVAEYRALADQKLGRVRYRSNEQEVFLGHSVAQSTNMSEETAKLIDEEVRRLIEADALAEAPA